MVAPVIAHVKGASQVVLPAAMVQGEAERVGLAAEQVGFVCVTVPSVQVSVTDPELVLVLETTVLAPLAMTPYDPEQTRAPTLHPVGPATHDLLAVVAVIVREGQLVEYTPFVSRTR